MLSLPLSLPIRNLVSQYSYLSPPHLQSDYDHRVLTMDRAFRGGIDDVGVGVLFGLHDYRFECMALLMHANHLLEEYKAGPHTISVPRMRPANQVEGEGGARARVVHQ